MPRTSPSAPSTGPILSVHVYEDGDYDGVLDQMERLPYGLTGSIIAQDRRAIAEATDRPGFAAGNFYINDKPTGAAGQPFGGRHWTNDKRRRGRRTCFAAGPAPRSIKETFVPPTSHTYPHMR